MACWILRWRASSRSRRSGIRRIVLSALETRIDHANGGDKENSFGFHHLEDFAIGAMAVLDGIDSGGHGVLDALRSGRVGGDFEALFMGFLHDDANLIDGERGVLPVRIDFDQVGAILNLFTDGTSGFLDAAHHLRAGGKIHKVGRDAKRVCTGQQPRWRASHLHFWALRPALVLMASRRATSA